MNKLSSSKPLRSVQIWLNERPDDNWPRWVLLGLGGLGALYIVVKFWWVFALVAFGFVLGRWTRERS